MDSNLKGRSQSQREATESQKTKSEGETDSGKS